MRSSRLVRRGEAGDSERWGPRDDPRVPPSSAERVGAERVGGGSLGVSELFRFKG